MENSTSSSSLVKFSLNRVLKLIFSCLLLILISNFFFMLQLKIVPKKFDKLNATSSLSYKFANITLPPKEFLVWYENCHILRFAKFRQHCGSYNTTKLTRIEPFVQKQYDPSLNQYRLKINADTEKILCNATCCYKEILFFDKSQSFGSTSCLKFHHDFLVPKHIKYGIIVSCYSSNSETPFFRDAFFFFQQDGSEFKNFNAHTEKNVIASSSILLIGIESLSQYIFQQLMPRSFEFIQQNGWFELSGYHTIAENTFPNLIALLAGLNIKDINRYYEGFKYEFLDDYRLVTQNFQKYGYLTAYNGDRSYNESWQFHKKNLRKTPTDFYILPLMDEFEKENGAGLPLNNISQYTTRKIKASLIFETLTEFSLIFKNRPTLGLFLTNFLSHDDNSSDRSDASFFDELVSSYMKKLKQYEVLQNNIIIFFSDHGMHWKKSRQYSYGFYEERLPIMYIWLPSNIRKKYPEFVYALTVNKNRLTSPYDIFLTLQHILSLSIDSNKTFQISNQKTEGCANCQSVLQPIPETRYCADAGISNDWCTCEPYVLCDPQSSFLFKIVNLVVQKINKFLADHFIFLCRKLKVIKINRAAIELKSYAQLKQREKLTLKLLDPANDGLLFRVNFITLPFNRIFEAAFLYFRHSHNISFNFHDICSFEYVEPLTDCVNDTIAKKFCICFED